MKYYVLALAGSLGMAQSSVSTYTTDLNGNRVGSSPTVSADGQHTQTSQSINGRQVPLEQTETKVLRDDANGKQVETIVRKYSPNGDLASTERTLTDTQKTADGSVAHSTIYRSDLNGNMREAERQVEETHQQGNTTRAESVIQRPTLNASFQPIEKRTSVTEVSGDNTHQDVTVLRASDNGNFTTALRQVKDTTKTGDQTVETMAQYEPRDTPALQLSRQTVSKTTKRSDGSQVSEVDLYQPAVPGVAQSTSSTPQLFEQQIISRDKGPGDAMVETLSVRRPSISDPAHLGSLQKISETVCTGKCTPDKP